MCNYAICLNTTVITVNETCPTATVTTVPSTTQFCYWTEWFSSEKGGESDNETYVNIKKTGKNICEHPIDIRCKSVTKDDMEFEQFINSTKQVVKCAVSSGLMCKKEDQIHRPKKCFDYKISVLCCVNKEIIIPPTPTPPLYDCPNWNKKVTCTFNMYCIFL